MLSSYRELLLGNRNFRLLWLAQVVSELGDWFYTLAVYHLLLDLTGGSARAVGLAVVLQVLPSTLAAPTAGVLNDRVSRKRVMIAADVARFFVVLAMMAPRTPGMVWLVYPLLFLETIGASFFEPAHSAVVPNIVAAELVTAANALASVTWSVCLAAGGALGGLAAAWLGRDAVFVLNALSFLASAGLIGRMGFAEPHLAGTAPFHPRELVSFTPVLEGLRYIGRDRRLLATVFVKGGIGVLGANNVLLPVLGERVFAVKSAALDPGRQGLLGMSLLMGARGVGSLAGPLAAGPWARDSEPRLRRAILAGFLAALAGYAALGWAGSLGLAVLAVALAHAGTSMNWVFSTTLVQRYTDDRFRGRVFAADYGLCTLTISASSYLAGVLLDLGMAPRALAVALGAAMLVPAAGWALALRATRRQPRT